MVFLTLSKKVTGVIGPLLFRTGLSARNVLSRSAKNDAPYLDMALLIPYAQKLMSLAVYDESQRMVSAYKDKSRVDQALDDTYDALFGKSKEDEEMEQASISEIRIQVLDDYLRPALLPNDRWEDTSKWRWNFRVMKWARMEFLVSKYGPKVKASCFSFDARRATNYFRCITQNRLLLFFHLSSLGGP